MGFLFDNLLEPSTSIVEEDSNTSKTYFFDALDFSSEVYKLYRESVDILYSRLADSNNDQDIIQESFNDFFKSIKLTIKSVEDKSKKMTVDLRNRLMKETSRDQEIIDNKDYIMNYNRPIKFNRSIFTNLDSDIPKNIIYNIYMDDYLNVKSILQKEKLDNTIKAAKIAAEYRKLSEEIKGDYYDRFRAKLLGYEGTLSTIQFASEVFNVFNGNGMKDTSMIFPDELKTIYKEYSNKKALYDKIERESRRIKFEYNRITSDINNTKFNQLNARYDKGFMDLNTQFDIFIKLKSEQIVKLSTMHLQVYSAKLDAIASKRSQDYNILKSIIPSNKIMKGDEE